MFGACSPFPYSQLYLYMCSPQANMVPISWDRVILYHLEEISIGVWQPVLSTS